jgi:hypothetical protein
MDAVGDLVAFFPVHDARAKEFTRDRATTS